MGVVLQKQKAGKVDQDHSVDLHRAASKISSAVVIELRSFEEAAQAVQALRESKIVILKLTLLEPDQARRAADFVTGGTYAIDGHTQRITEKVFLFTPRGVQVSTQ